jgi:RNA polymerase sigma factor (TIGR02999 family)
MPELDSRDNVTILLLEWRHGDQEALDRLLPIVYSELRRIARGRLRREPAGHTLQPTDLVHEAYLRLVKLDRITIEGRAHFFALAARLMRQVLVDHVRRKRAGKRGGAVTLLGLGDDVAQLPGEPVAVDVIALDRALDELAALEPRLARVVELRAFAGLTLQETAVALDVSHATVERDWAMARAWLYRRLTA